MKTLIDKSSTAGESSPDLLTGQTVRLWPYVRGLYSRDVLYRLWRLIEDAHASGRLFWASTEPVEQRGDLSFFIKFVETPERLLVLLTSLDSSEIVGCVWFDDIVPHYRCFGSIFIRPESRGVASQEAMRLCLHYAFHLLHIKSVWGITPWADARALCLKSGFRVVATLPAFALIEGASHDVSVLRIEKETFDGIIIS